MATPSEQLSEELISFCGHTFEEILDRKSEEDFRQLRSVLADDGADAVQRQNAVHLLGHWGNPDVVADIVGMMSQLDEPGLMNAIDALGRLGSDDALGVVLDYSRHDSADVRRFAVSALEQIGGQEALARLSAMAIEDDTGFVRTKAQRLLQRAR